MLRLGSALGPGAQVEGPGSCRPAMAESGGPPTATVLGKCMADRRLPSLTANYLE